MDKLLTIAAASLISVLVIANVPQEFGVWMIITGALGAWVLFGKWLMNV